MAKTVKKTSRRPSAAASAGMIGAASALFGAGAAHALAPGATPEGARVVGGSASVTQAGSTVTVNQSSNRTVIDWRSFDIGSNAQAVFNQPNASAIAVNRVNASTDPTRIEGSLTANGQVWILNPNGVLFGKTATVNVAGLMASTANIDPSRFMAGDNRLTFTSADHGAVANDGAITIAEGGLAAFVAPSVRNSGVINARVGKVTLAAGTTFTLDLAGDGLVELGLGSGHAVVDQSGMIVDAGGVVALTARSAGQVVDSVINMSGVIDASSATASGGQIVLGADNVTTTASAVMKADGAGAGGQIVAVADKTGDYAGSFSARGGALGGDGGHVETSGAVLHVADGVSVDTMAANGRSGDWTLDPDTLTVGDTGSGSISGGVNSDADQTIAASTVVTALNTTNVTLRANSAITVNTAIDASANSAAHNLTLADEDGGGLTVNLNKAITLKSGGVLSGQATTINLTGGALIQNGNDVALAGATVNLAAGLYAPGATLTKSNLTLAGAPGAEIDVNPGSSQLNAVNIGGGTSGVTVKGLIINGEITGSYIDYAFGSGVSRGIAVANGATNFTLTGNTITNVRNGILIDGRYTGSSSSSVTGNLIDNTKSGISVQYTDGTGINIANNSQGSFGNEWGLILHLNGVYDFNAGTTVADPTSGAVATSPVQSALLADSAANSGWSVQDLAYNGSNRTSVVVATNGSSTNQGSPRAPLDTIQAGIAAVVAGGVVDLDNGTYVIPAGGGNYIDITKPLSLVGQSENGVIIDARNASTYGLRVAGGAAGFSNVSLSNFTLYGVTASGGYGLKAENVGNLTIANVTSQGAAKSEFDLNGVIGGSLDHLTANGAPVAGGANTGGNGISFTDSQNITLTNSTTLNNGWGGLALYQSNSPSGYTYQETGITVGGSNTFNEANPVYAENQSSTNQFGTLNISGFTYLVKSPTNPSDVYTWFQRTAQNAIDFAAGVSPSAAYVVGYGSGVTGNNHFTVGVSTGGQALSIQNAVNAAANGAIIDIASGNYAQSVISGLQASYNLGQVALTGGFVLQPGANSGLSGSLTAASIGLGAPVTLAGNLTLASTGAITTGAIDASTAGSQTLTVNGSSVSLGSLGSGTRLGAVQTSGPTTLTGSTYNAGSLAFGGPVVLASNVSLASSGAITTGAIDASTAGGQTLTVNGGSVSLGSLGSSTRLGAVEVSGPTTLAGSTYDANSLTFGGATTLTASNTTLNTTQTGAAGNITVSGNVLGSSNGAQNLIMIAGPGTGSANGDISLQSVGTLGLALGDLTISGRNFDAQTVRVGNFKSTLTGNQVFSSHTLDAGGTVNANVGGDASGPINATQAVSFNVGGGLTGAIAGTDVSLTVATLTQAIVTATGNAAVTAGAVTGSTVNAGQNINLNATTLAQTTANASQSASVNAGAVTGSTLTAGQNLNVTADTFAQTTANASQSANVNAGALTGSTVQAGQALNVKATQVAGSTLGGATVTANATNFNAVVNASGAANISGGNVSGTFNAGSIKLAGTDSVTGTVNASTVSVSAPHGSVAGNWQSLDAGSGGGVLVNNQPVTLAASGANPSQLVVENFTLPAGTTVTPRGALVLPQGVVVGLLSPAGADGAPKLIQVQSVQDLGSLLSQGYTGIVIDLSGSGAADKDDKPQRISQR